uniref:O-acyltransferase like n=1 Tax=Amphiprion percula TaxID=161767 RepID=A0A3P8TIB0_AMPPE
MALSLVVFLLLVGGSAELENTQASAVSQRCMKDTNAFLWEITQDKPKEYAVLMYDSYGKMGSNVEGGNANRPGLLQQCRSANGPSFSGQYCQVFLRQGTVQYFVGLCVPDSCREEEVQILVLLRFGQTSLVPPLPSILVNQSTQEMIMTHCLPQTIAPDASDVTCLSVYDYTLSAVSPVPTVESSRLNNTSPTAPCFPWSCVLGCLQVFSLQNTSQGIFSASSSIPGGGYSSLNGIRVLSLLWIICGHSAQFPVINNLDNYKNWKKTVESSPLYVLTISGPVFLAVDTFLLLGIQPLHLFIMCLTIGLISLVQWGPYWFPFIDTLMDCKTYWWANLLLISNLLPVHEIVSLSSAYRLTSDNYVLYYYVKPYTRYSPFLIGILTGIHLTTKKDQLLKQKWQAALGWLCCLSVMALLVGLAFILRETPDHPSLPHALYQGLHRPLWALAVSWIILACEEGYGGFIKRLLSLSFWVPLSNISFACYLIHPVFIIVYIGLQETPIHYSDINFMYLFLGHLVLTLVVSCMLMVLVEKPYLLLKWRTV